MSAVMTCAFIFSLSAGPATVLSAKDSKPLFGQVDAVKNISQLMRSNARHFWEYVNHPERVKDLAPYINESGVISGDLHLGNMSVIPVKTLQGEQKLKFLNIDFDDSGKGPFALEFTRFVSVAKASSDKIKIKDLMQAYLQGLRGVEIKKPAAIARAENMDIKSFESLRAAYVNKKMLNGQFKYKAGEIEKWDGRPNKSDLELVFKDAKVIDVAKRPVESGGSADAGTRLWVLTQDTAGAFRIIELKPYAETSLAEFYPQADPVSRVHNLYDTYWPGIDSSSYSLTKIQGIFYWVREKKVEVLEYENKAAEDSGRLYIANAMGLTQSRQSGSADLLKKIEQDPEHFRSAIKAFVKEYVGEANAALD